MSTQFEIIANMLEYLYERTDEVSKSEFFLIFDILLVVIINNLHGL